MPRFHHSNKKKSKTIVSYLNRSLSSTIIQTTPPSKEIPIVLSDTNRDDGTTQKSCSKIHAIIIQKISEITTNKYELQSQSQSQYQQQQQLASSSLSEASSQNNSRIIELKQGENELHELLCRKTVPTNKHTSNFVFCPDKLPKSGIYFDIDDCYLIIKDCRCITTATSNESIRNVDGSRSKDCWRLFLHRDSDTTNTEETEQIESRNDSTRSTRNIDLKEWEEIPHRQPRVIASNSNDTILLRCMNATTCPTSTDTSTRDVEEYTCHYVCNTTMTATSAIDSTTNQQQDCTIEGSSILERKMYAQEEQEEDDTEECMEDNTPSTQVFTVEEDCPISCTDNSNTTSLVSLELLPSSKKKKDTRGMNRHMEKKEVVILPEKIYLSPIPSQEEEEDQELPLYSNATTASSCCSSTRSIVTTDQIMSLQKQNKLQIKSKNPSFSTHNSNHSNDVTRSSSSMPTTPIQFTKEDHIKNSNVKQTDNKQLHNDKEISTPSTTIDKPKYEQDTCTISSPPATKRTRSSTAIKAMHQHSNMDAATTNNIIMSPNTNKRTRLQRRSKKDAMEENSNAIIPFCTNLRIRARTTKSTAMNQTQQPIRILITGVQMTPQIKQAISSLPKSISILTKLSEAHTATHVIASPNKSIPIRRTPKLMIGMNVTNHILYATWLLSPRMDTDVDEHLIQENHNEPTSKYNFHWKDTRANFNHIHSHGRDGLLSDYTIYISTPFSFHNHNNTNKFPSLLELQYIIQSANGTIITNLSTHIPNKFLYFVNERITRCDKQMIEDFNTSSMKSGNTHISIDLHCRTIPWLFQCIMDQKLNGIDDF